MSLGLDLRGGVYVLLEVDMDTAIGNRMLGYEQDFEDRLREARIRHRVDLNNGIITVRLTSADDLEAARRVVNEADAELLVADGTDGKSLTIRMTEQQIKDRQDFAIEQNMTTLRNRVDQLGVAEPLVQRQGVDRIVVQLPGVQDPTELEKILTATDKVGKLAGIPVVVNAVNAVNRSKAGRKLLESTLGVHRDAPVPDYHSKTARKRLSRSGS